MSQNQVIMSGTMFASGTFLNSSPVVVPCVSLGVYFTAWLRFAVQSTQKTEYSVDGGLNYTEFNYVLTLLTYKESSGASQVSGVNAYTHIRFTGVAGNTYGIVH